MEPVGIVFWLEARLKFGPRLDQGFSWSFQGRASSVFHGVSWEHSASPAVVCSVPVVGVI